MKDHVVEEFWQQAMDLKVRWMPGGLIWLLVQKKKNATSPSQTPAASTPASISSSPMTTSEENNNAEKGWTPLAVKALIHIYESKKNQFVGNNKKRNKVWIEIAEQMKDMGFPFSEKQVKNKFHYLKNKF